MTLSDYLLREVEIAAETPPLHETIRRIRSGKLSRFETRSADLIREDRDSR
jgi:hypothetical protein